MLGESGLLPKLRHIAKPNGEPYVIYGDPTYGLSRNILAPYRGAILTADEKQFNSAMSKVRVRVGFWENSPELHLCRFQEKFENFTATCSKYYLVAGILTNCHTCLYDCVVSSFFEFNNPPQLEEYLSNQ